MSISSSELYKDQVLVRALYLHVARVRDTDSGIPTDSPDVDPKCVHSWISLLRNSESNAGGWDDRLENGPVSLTSHFSTCSNHVERSKGSSKQRQMSH